MCAGVSINAAFVAFYLFSFVYAIAHTFENCMHEIEIFTLFESPFFLPFHSFLRKAKNNNNNNKRTTHQITEQNGD